MYTKISNARIIDPVSGDDSVTEIGIRDYRIDRVGDIGENVANRPRAEP
jgi:predicted amidohydrolase